MAVTINGTTGVSQVQDGIVTDDKLDLSANSAEVKEALNASGTAPIYACRAWVNFDGTGTVAIRASGNVSSITDNGNGDYTVNFATAMPDANYAAECTAHDSAGATVSNNGLIVQGKTGTAATTTAFRLTSATSTGFGLNDLSGLNVAIFR